MKQWLIAVAAVGLLGCAALPPAAVEVGPVDVPLVTAEPHLSEVGAAPQDSPVPPPIPAMSAAVIEEDPPVKNPVQAMRQALQQAKIEPPWRRMKGALVTFRYQPYVLYHVYTAPDHQTDLEWPPGETLRRFSKADSEGWDMADAVSGAGEQRQFHLLIKPKIHGLKTNIVALTDRHTYHIALTSTQELYLPIVTWHDPTWFDQPKLAENPAPRLPARLYTGYTVKVIGKTTPPWTPTGAWDDGARTVIEFPPALLTGEAPNVWIITADGVVKLTSPLVQLPPRMPYSPHESTTHHSPV